MDGSGDLAVTMVDDAFFEELRATGGDELLGLLIDSAEQESAQFFASLQSAHESGDARRCEEALHALKGAGAAVGLVQFTAQAERGLNRFRAGELMADHGLRELERLWLRSVAAFRELAC